MTDQIIGVDGGAAPETGAADPQAPAPATEQLDRPAVGDVTPRGTVFGVRVHEGAVFVQFAEAGEWLPA